MSPPVLSTQQALLNLIKGTESYSIFLDPQPQPCWRNESLLLKVVLIVLLLNIRPMRYISHMILFSPGITL